MALTLRHIEVIRAVLRAGTLTSAARQLAVSQPALSRTLKSAENRLGLLLFERRSGRLHPTPEALALHRDIEKAYAEIEAVQRTSTDLRHARGGRLSIVCNPSVAATIGAEAIGRLTRDAPGVRISLRTALNHEVIEYIDKEGRTILKKVETLENGLSVFAETYYIYDDFDNLVMVLPPEAMKRVKTVLIQP